MTSQVLSGSSNPSYTNNTGQNVRIVINFMASVTSISWAGVSAQTNRTTIGRNLAFQTLEQTASSIQTVSSTIRIPARIGTVINGNFSDKISTINIPTSSGGIALSSNNMGSNALPTELMLAPNQTFSATCGAYNIVVIPEAG